MVGDASDPAPNGVGLKASRIERLIEGACGTFFGQAFDEAVQDEGDFDAWSVQAIQRRHSAGGDLAFASLAHEIGDRLACAMMTVVNQGVLSVIGDATILTIQMGAGEASS